jgi:hypothetical protein
VVRKLPRPERNRPGRDGNLFVLSHASHERLSHATVRQWAPAFTASFALNELQCLLSRAGGGVYRRVAFSLGDACVASACRMRSSRRCTRAPDNTLTCNGPKCSRDM